MSLTRALSTGLSGILANQKAVEVTGNNISNINTPGYSRQIAGLSPKTAIKIQGQYVGQGVKVQEIIREYDRFIAGQLVNQNEVLGREMAKNSPLAELERIFNLGDESLASDIERFFGAWHNLSQNPGGHIERDRVIFEGENLLDSFDQTLKGLIQIRQNISTNLSAKINEINSKLKEIATLNVDIQSKEILGYSANLDHDRRDMLVNDISRLIGAQVYQASPGQIGVQLPGGVSLVQGNSAVDVEAYYDGDRLCFQIRLGDITQKTQNNNFGGEFRGFLDVRDNLIPELEKDLDSLRYNLITHVNARHEAGYNLDGLTGQAFFTKPLSYRSETGFADPEVHDFQTGTIEINGTVIEITDENNSLNGIRNAINGSEAGVLASVVHDGAQYRLSLTPKNQGTPVTFISDLTTGGGLLNFINEDGDPDLLDEIPGVENMRVLVGSTQQVAAAGVTRGAPGDNQNALAINDLLSSRLVNGKDTFVEYYGRISSTVGTESKRNAMAYGGANDTMIQLENMRESVVGVSLEQEIINLTLFQRGFEASATFVSTIDEMMSTVLNMKR